MTVKRYTALNPKVRIFEDAAGGYVRYSDYAALEQRIARLICPHGDPCCPCRDGDSCHYEGENPMTPPLKLLEQRIETLERALEKIADGTAFQQDAKGNCISDSMSVARAALAETEKGEKL
jgi:hypothetical protein